MANEIGLTTDTITRTRLTVGLVGPGMSGKDTAARWLADHTTLRWTGATTSTVLAEHMVRHYVEAGEIVGDVDGEAVMQFRRRDRQLWFDKGNKLRAVDSLALVRPLLPHSDIVVGMRSQDEVDASRALLDLIVWIDRRDERYFDALSAAVRIPKSYFDDPTMAFGPESCDLTVFNCGTVEDLYRKLGRLSGALGILR